MDWTRSFLKVSGHQGRSLHGPRHSETVLNFSVDICPSYPSSILTEAFLSLLCLSVSRNHFPSEIRAVFSVERVFFSPPASLCISPISLANKRLFLKIHSLQRNYIYSYFNMFFSCHKMKQWFSTLVAPENLLRHFENNPRAQAVPQAS